MVALTRGIGKQLQIGIAKESTRGTPVASATYWLPVDDWAIEEKYKNAVDVQTYGLIENAVSQTRVKNWAEGSIKMPLTGTTAALLFLSLLGTDTPATHAGETTVYDHPITVAQNVQHQSLTFFVHDPIATAGGSNITADYSHANGVVSKIALDYSLGKFIELTATIKAQKGSSAAVAFTPSQQVETRFVPQYLTFKSAATLGALVGATAIKLKSAKIDIDNSEEDDDVMGTTTPRDFLNKEFKVSGSFEAIWQNESDFKINALANTPQAIQFDLINTDVTMGMVPTNPEFKVTLAKVYFTDFSRPVKIKDLMYQTVKFEAVYSVSDAQMIKVTATNQVASY